VDQILEFLSLRECQRVPVNADVRLRMGILGFGLNCPTGAREMAVHWI